MSNKTVKFCNITFFTVDNIISVVLNGGPADFHGALRMTNKISTFYKPIYLYYSSISILNTFLFILSSEISYRVEIVSFCELVGAL